MTFPINKQVIVSVGLIEKDSKFLLMRRVSPNEPLWDKRWELPGGKIEPGETPEKALYREIFEEAGLYIRSAALLGVYTNFWYLEEKTQQTFVLVYHCKVSNETITLDDQAHDAYSWESIEEILEKKDLLNGTKEILETLWINKKMDS